MTIETEYPEKKALLFDVDGTLYSDYTQFRNNFFFYFYYFPRMLTYFRMRKQVRKELKSNVHVDIFLARSRSLFSKYHGLDETTVDVFLNKFVKKLWINVISNTPLRPGMRSFLRGKKIPLAILSDFEAYSKLRRWGIEEYFSEIANAEEFGTLKPQKRVFLSVAKRLQCEPQNCIFVGNHFYYDGLGAAAAGMQSVCITHKKYKSIAKDIPNLDIVTTEKELYTTIEKKLV